VDLGERKEWGGAWEGKERELRRGEGQPLEKKFLLQP